MHRVIAAIVLGAAVLVAVIWFTRHPVLVSHQHNVNISPIRIVGPFWKDKK